MGTLLPAAAARRHGLRPRIALLSFLTAVPLLALLVVGAVIDRQEAIHSAEWRVIDLARLGTEEQHDMAADATNLLRVLVHVPAVREMAPIVCHDIVRQVVAADPRIDAITVSRPNGDMACNSETTSAAVNVADRAYFHRAISAAAGAPGATELIIGRLRGKPTAVLALPVASAPGEPPAGVITAALSLDHLSYLAAQNPAGTDYVALIVSPTDGMVLATAPEEPQLIGRSISGHPLISAFHGAPAGGSVIVADLRGVPRIFGFAPLSVGDTALFLAVGLSRADVLTAANSRLFWGIGLAIGATFIALALAWSTARSMLLQPIEALADVAVKLGTGDLTVRATTRGNLDEIQALGFTFNRMACRLQSRDEQLASAQAALQRSEAQHRLLADNATDMISSLTPDFRHTYVSPACYDLLGYRQDELVGRATAEIVHPDDWPALNTTFNGPLRAGQLVGRASFRALRKDGSSVWLEAHGRRLAAGGGYIVVSRDVTERKMFERQLEDANRQLEVLAMADPLTGLANRRRFDEMMALEYRRAQRLEAFISILMIDADRFKAYNDLYGHPAGDECLRAIARAVGGALHRAGDLAARYGGEEFAVLLPNTEGAGACHVARTIAAAVRLLAIPHAGGPNPEMTVSIGVAAIIPNPSDQGPAGLIEAADRALYAAKAAGRDAIHLADRATETASARPAAPGIATATEPYRSDA